MILNTKKYKVGNKNVQKIYQGSTQRYAAGTPWTLVMVPDTQFLLTTGGMGTCPVANGGAEIVRQMFQYVADQKDIRNIKQLVHVGDVIAGGGSSTDFAKMVTARAEILAVDIPHTFTDGNHDEASHAQGSTRNLTAFNTAFPLSSYSNKSWFGGAYASGSENMYTIQTISGEKWMFLTVEFFPRIAVMNWMNSVIASEAPDFCVVTTHAYLAPADWVNPPSPTETFWDGKLIEATYKYGPNVYGSAYTTSGEDLYNNVISQNDCIILVLCGHVLDGRHDPTDLLGGTNNNVAHSGLQFTHANGNICTQIVYNHQNDSILACPLTEGRQGTSAALHFFEVNPATRTITATGYDPYHDVDMATLGSYPTLRPDWAGRHNVTFNY